MARRRALDSPPAAAAEPSYREIHAVLELARAGAWRAVNTAIVHAY